MQHTIQFGPRLERRWKWIARIELNGAHQPVAQCGGQGLDRARRRKRPGPVRHVGDSRWVIVFSEWATDDQRECGDAGLGDVATPIELRPGAGTRQRNAERLPVLLVGVMELIECRAQHVLDEHQTRLRRDDDALGANRAVTDVRHLLV